MQMNIERLGAFICLEKKTVTHQFTEIFYEHNNF
jgi:hypothetical protein